VIRQAFVFFVPGITFASAVLKEALIWVNALAPIVIIRRGEHLPTSSIGPGTARWWKSILLGFVIAIVLAIAVGALAYLTGYGNGPGSVAFHGKKRDGQSRRRCARNFLANRRLVGRETERRADVVCFHKFRPLRREGRVREDFKPV